MSVNPTTGLPGGHATVSVTLRNQGSGTASASTTRLRINLSSATVSTSDLPILADVNVPAIAPNGTYVSNTVVTIPANRPAGTNYIWATADVNSTANQSNESNDRGNAAFTVQNVPDQLDLIVQNMSVNPTTGLPGSSATVSVTLRNQGSGTASASTTRLRINLSSATVSTSDLPILADVNVPAIAPNGTYVSNTVVTIPANRPAGTDYIWATADAFNVANQSNQSNDQAVAAYSVQAAHRVGPPPSRRVRAPSAMEVLRRFSSLGRLQTAPQFFAVYRNSAPIAQALPSATLTHTDSAGVSLGGELRVLRPRLKQRRDLQLNPLPHHVAAQICQSADGADR